MQGWSQEGRCCYVNLTAALTARMNAQANGYGGRVAGVGSNFSSALSPKPLVDVILANQPFCGGCAWDGADRAWRAGPQYRDIEALFYQAADLKLLGSFVRRAGLSAKVSRRRSVC